MMNWITTTILLIPVLLTAQRTGTTLDEFRYLSKGYAYQKSMGLDASKEGYVLQDLAPENMETGFIAMYKNGEPQVRAILLILQKNKVQPIYLCLPNNQSDESVRQLLQADLKQLTEADLKESYLQALQQLAFYLLDNQNRLDKAVVKTENTTFTSEDMLQEKGNDTVNPLQSYDFQSKGIAAEDNSNRINTAVAITMDEHMVQRVVLKAPVIVGNYKAKGKVAIKFCVDVNGDVSSAKFTQLGSTTFNEALMEKARNAVLESKFAASTEEHCGKVVFHFQ